MIKKIFLFAGYPATGKTSFSTQLSQSLKIPCFNKDYFKEILAETIGFENRQENLALSVATFGILAQFAEQQMKCGLPVILESNFRPAEATILKRLIKLYGYIPLTFMHLGDTKVLHERFLRREKSDERHFAHKAQNLENYDDYLASIGILKDFSVGGRVVTIDATDFKNIDYDTLTKTAYEFMLYDPNSDKE